MVPDPKVRRINYFMLRIFFIFDSLFVLSANWYIKNLEAQLSAKKVLSSNTA
jgi:hypothetical protein